MATYRTDRLRDRASAAGSHGIYVSVVVLDGFRLHLSQPPEAGRYAAEWFDIDARHRHR